MDAYRSQFITTRGVNYSYNHVPPQSDKNSTILFLHGFPSTSYDWRHQISFFAATGYGILAPDLLGFGKTSKPMDLEMFKGKDMARDVIEIAVHQKIHVMIGVGHDWGSLLLSHLANYLSERFSSYVFIDHGYITPGRGLTTPVIKQINKTIQEKLGYLILGYFLFFDDEDAEQLLNEHSASVQSLYFTSDDDLNKKYKGAAGDFREWLAGDQIADLPSFVTHEDRKHYEQVFLGR